MVLGLGIILDEDLEYYYLMIGLIFVIKLTFKKEGE